MATKRITINKSDGTSDTVDFTVPETAGNYALKFNMSDGSVLDAGNFIVGGPARTYNLKLGLSDGKAIDAGTFTTPAASGWVTLTDYTFDGEYYKYRICEEADEYSSDNYDRYVGAIRVTATITESKTIDGFTGVLRKTEVGTFAVQTSYSPAMYFDGDYHLLDENGERIKDSSGDYIRDGISTSNECRCSYRHPYEADSETHSFIYVHPDIYDESYNISITIDKVEVWYTAFENKIRSSLSYKKLEVSNDTPSYGYLYDPYVSGDEIKSNRLTLIEGEITYCATNGNYVWKGFEVKETLCLMLENGTCSGSLEWEDELSNKGTINYTLTLEDDAKITLTCSSDASLWEVSYCPISIAQYYNE